MRSTGLRTLAAAVAGAALIAAALALACFRAPPVEGLYHCNTGQTCPAPYLCVDELCCIPRPGGVPECPSDVGPDGRCADGGTPGDYFLDEDEDGYGADWTERLACHTPQYHFTRAGGDCNDDPDAGGAICHPGAPDPCDGLDNDCSGSADDRPGCGGPSPLLIGPGIVVGAKKLMPTWFNQTPLRCLRDDPNDPNPADMWDQPSGTWQGGRSGTHVYWAQAPAGATWDLRQPGKSLRLVGTVEMGSANYPTSPIWYPVPQPWIMLCAGSAGFIRLARDTSLFSLTDQTKAAFDDTVPARGGNGWSIQPGSSADVDAVLQQVEHVEVLVEPAGASGGATFWIDFNEAQVGFP